MRTRIFNTTDAMDAMDAMALYKKVKLSSFY